MDEFVTKFVNIQCYVPYLREEKAKVCRFINYFIQAYKDKIKFDMPKTMDDAIRKSKLFFLQFKQWYELNKSCQHKKKEKQGQRKNVYKPSPFKKGTRIYSDNNYNRFKNPQNYSTGGEV